MQLVVFSGLGLVVASIFRSSTPPSTPKTLPVGVIVLFVEALAPCCWKSGKNVTPEERTCTQKFILMTAGLYARFLLHGLCCAIGIIVAVAIAGASWFVWLSLGVLGATSLLYVAAACQGGEDTDGSVKLPANGISAWIYFLKANFLKRRVLYTTREEIIKK